MSKFRLVGRLLLLSLVGSIALILIGARRSYSEKITTVTSQLQQPTPQKLNQKYHQSKTATLFLHGYNGGAQSTNHLIHQASQAGAAQKALVVHIYKNGVMDFQGYWQKSLKNPMVQVVFEDNRASQTKQITWLHQVLRQLKSRFGVQSYNAVGHSLGSNDIVNEALMYGHDAKAPRLKRIVTIGGPFDGLTGFIDASGLKQVRATMQPQRFTRHFKQMLQHRMNFPKHVRLLNVVGDTNQGFNNDGFVGVASAQSVRYLLKGQLKSYQELFVKGQAGAHCQLNRDQRVASSMIRFLWH